MVNIFQERQESDKSSSSDDSSDSDDSDLDEDAIARRRELMRQRALYKAQAGDVQVSSITVYIKKKDTKREKKS